MVPLHRPIAGKAFRPCKHPILGIVWKFIYIKGILHTCYKFSIVFVGMSMMRASARPSSTRLELSELTLRLNSFTASIPPSKYFFMILINIARHTPFDFSDCSWVNTFPLDSFRAIMFWHLLQMVLDVLFFRMTD